MWVHFLDKSVNYFCICRVYARPALESNGLDFNEYNKSLGITFQMFIIHVIDNNVSLLFLFIYLLIYLLY